MKKADKAVKDDDTENTGVTPKIFHMVYHVTILSFFTQN